LVQSVPHQPLHFGVVDAQLHGLVEPAALAAAAAACSIAAFTRSHSASISASDAASPFSLPPRQAIARAWASDAARSAGAGALSAWTVASILIPTDVLTQPLTSRYIQLVCPSRSSLKVIQ